MAEIAIDLVTFAFGIAAGIAIGLFSIQIGNVPVGLGLAGGLLLAGLLIGMLRTQVPNLGRVPPAARWVFMELGLLFFMEGLACARAAGSSRPSATRVWSSSAPAWW